LLVGRGLLPDATGFLGAGWLRRVRQVPPADRRA